MSSFAFLASEWPGVFEAASKSESLAVPDPRTACFYARRALELAVFWLYKSDSALRLPYQQHLSALIDEPTFRTVAGSAILAKARVIKETRQPRRPLSQSRGGTRCARRPEMKDGLTSIRGCFRRVPITGIQTGTLVALAVLALSPEADANTNLPPSPIRQVWGGGRHTMALLWDGSVWTWGSDVSASWVTAGSPRPTASRTTIVLCRSGCTVPGTLAT
jgi:hypothetical protein